MCYKRIKAVICAFIILLCGVGVNANAAAAEKVFCGGFPIAMRLNVDGVIVDGVDSVETDVGRVYPCRGIKVGDLIVSANGQKISDSEDICALIDSGATDLELRIRRDGAEVDCRVEPAKEAFSGKYKLGLDLRDSVIGVGMVSFITSDLRFGALGHPVVDSVAGKVPISGGEIYDCSLLGIKPGARGRAGEMKFGVNLALRPIGVIYKNTDSGVYGKFHDYESGAMIETASRGEAAMGKAQILTTIDGATESYDIEIIRAMSQGGFDDKGLVLRVVDKRLLAATGGIVQGMSGSPIVQNGRLIGAVTHVFVNDPTKGYGIYMDFMRGSL